MTKQLADARREHRSEELFERRMRKEENRYIIHDVRPNCKIDERRTVVGTLLELSLHRSKDDVQNIIFYLAVIQRRTFKYQQNPPPFSSLLKENHESRVKRDVS